MPICAIYGCRTRSKSAKRPSCTGSSVGLHSMPKIITRQCERTRILSEKRRSLWLARINRSDLKNLENVRVCGRHFITGKPSKLMDEANPDWAPMQHLGYGSERPLTNEARFERSKKRSQKKKEKDAVEASVATQQSPAGIEFPESGASSENEAECRMELPVSTVDSEPRRRDIGVQTDLTGHNIQALKADNKRLTCELCTLKKQKELLEVTEESLRQDDAKVAFYSGMINYSVLHAIFQLVESAVKHTPQNGLPKFQEFIIFLMKLKFNFPHQDLAYRFHISCATVSRIFEKWLDAAFSRLRSQIVWPSRNDIQRTMPQAFFESFGSKVAVIIDCFEIRIERPSSLQPRSETWSNYKNSNTAKFLIGICPQGVITYISEGWGGRASDKHITEHCGILEYLSQGDVVLADRGFDIAELDVLASGALQRKASDHYQDFIWTWELIFQLLDGGSRHALTDAAADLTGVANRERVVGTVMFTPRTDECTLGEYCEKVNIKNLRQLRFTVCLALPSDVLLGFVASCENMEELRVVNCVVEHPTDLPLLSQRLTNVKMLQWSLYEDRRYESWLKKYAVVDTSTRCRLNTLQSMYVEVAATLLTADFLEVVLNDCHGLPSFHAHVIRKDAVEVPMGDAITRMKTPRPGLRTFQYTCERVPPPNTGSYTKLHQASYDSRTCER
ncbi:uncharacterized protein LOC142568350 [Dermacentor variabilis]|uniref:uncharacterized protein LOC142568350 n=1 Tax=Dermacentor variabilis TaxID=34621 RepID=UPI003F5BBAB7